MANEEFQPTENDVFNALPRLKHLPDETHLPLYSFVEVVATSRHVVSRLCKDDAFGLWLKEGNVIMDCIEKGRGGAFFAAAFKFGAWWADRPWRVKT